MKPNLNRLSSLYNNDLDAQQRAFCDRYADDTSFQTYLSTKLYFDIPATINYLLLVEKEVSPKNMPAFFIQLQNQQAQANKEAEAIRSCPEKANYWTSILCPPEGNGLTNPKDLKIIDQLCRQLSKNQHDANAMLVAFFMRLLEAKQALSANQLNSNKSVEDALNELPDNWYAEPWYYTYVQYFGTDEKGKGNFKTLAKMLDYLEGIGIYNIYILPHYESPNGDAGYDISDYRPAKAYGGLKQFKAFIKAATLRGFRVATDLVFNHTSAQHKWFLNALDGNSQYYDYYLKCPAEWDQLALEQVLKDEGGDFFLYLPEKDKNGQLVTSKRILIFPDVDKTLWLKKQVKGLDEPALFYREFYPFQVDLDLQNPKVIDELFRFLGEEISLGVLGKRTDAIAHWIKKPGTNAKDLPETYALQMLIKQFLKHISPKTIILPEVVTDSLNLKGYAGEPTTINGQKTTTGGDALLDFQLQGMLREMLYFQKTTPFWTQVHERGEEGTNTSVPLVPIEHHDETYMGFFQEIEAMRGYIKGSYTYQHPNEGTVLSRRGLVYKNGMSGGARYAECLNQDVRRMAMAFFCLYLMPATPVLYYGTEIMATNQWDHMKKRQKAQFADLQKLLGDSIVGPGKAIDFEKCEDPRELQRGPIMAQTFFDALSNNHPVLKVIRAMNGLRHSYPALRSFELSHLDTYDAAILGMVRFAEKSNEKPVIALVNLSERPLEAQIPVWQLWEKLPQVNPTFTEILHLNGDGPNHAELNEETSKIQLNWGEFVKVPMPAYSFRLWTI